MVELFAGVGGFRLGLERASDFYDVVWSNQYEPGASLQIASQVYQYRWGLTNHVSDDIHKIVTAPTLSVPPHDMIVGGFPCQDYSVANTLRNSRGIEGKKGVLWWDIYELLSRFQDEEDASTKYLMLENVDRLLKSPVKQRGRDFAIMLASLADLGYVVEWRVINAAEYGMPQRRRRVFILAYHETTGIGRKAISSSPSEWIRGHGVIARAFPVLQGSDQYETVKIEGTPQEVTEKFNAGAARLTGPFENAGLMVGREAYTTAVFPPRLSLEQIEDMALRCFLDDDTDLSPFIVPKDIVRDTVKGWAFHKGPKSKERVDPNTGFKYQWSEGGMSLTDDLNKPARTIITSEGGATPSRSKHLIRMDDGRYRRLTPVELERVSMFPDDHTRYARKSDGEAYEVSPASRAFFIGNALVVGVVERLGQSLMNSVEEERDGLFLSHAS